MLSRMTKRLWLLVGLATVALAALLWSAAGSGAPAARVALLAPAAGTPAYFPIIARNGQLGGATATPPPVALPSNPADWQALLSYFRAAARLPALAVDPSWNDEARRYACQVVQSNSVGPSAPPDAACGAASTVIGGNSLVYGNGNPATTDRQAIETWLTWPFHALYVLDPELLSTGFGSFRAAADTGADPVDMAGVLDVRRGRATGLPAVTFPVVWPSHNATMYLTQLVTAPPPYPDPRASCPGYNVPLGNPAGLPLLVQLGAGDVITSGTTVPIVLASSLTEDGVQREHCVFSERDYASADPDEQARGRAILAERDAIVLVPRNPLVVGRTYQVSITAAGFGVSWSFRVAAAP
jgi:hypothetical protein